jgi:hypothetical protein
MFIFPFSAFLPDSKCRLKKFTVVWYGSIATTIWRCVRARHKEMNSKQKRSFHTILSGLKYSRYGNKPVRFLTLTTSSIMAQSVDFTNGTLNEHFQALRKRILRCSPYRLFKDGYITEEQMKHYYGHDSLTKKFTFEYFKVETNEGNGVLHIVYRGSYLPQSWLSTVWTEIHNSPIVNIKLLDFKDMKKTACYIVSQYLSSQGSSYVRSSQSWNWVFRGFKKMWYGMKRSYPKSCFNLWDSILEERARKYFYLQSNLIDYG